MGVYFAGHEEMSKYMYKHLVTQRFYFCFFQTFKESNKRITKTAIKSNVKRFPI